MRGIGLGRTGVLVIVGVCATFWKKLDPDALFGAILTLFTRAGLVLSVETVGRGCCFVAVDVVFAGAAMEEVAVTGAAEVAAGLSTFALEINLEFK